MLNFVGVFDGSLLVRVIIIVTVFVLGWVQGVRAEVVQNSVVFIKVECIHPENATVHSSTGSGAVISKDGLIITAAHVLSCVIGKKQYDFKEVRASIGTPDRPLNPLRVVDKRHEDNFDLAILKFAFVPDAMLFSQICRLKNPPPKTQFFSHGFPEGEVYQAVPGTIGAETADLMWNVEGAFAPGMSGGPVEVDGRIVGIVKGGSRELQARRKVFPVYRASSMLDEAGLDDFEACPGSKVSPGDNCDVEDPLLSCLLRESE